MVAEVEGRLRLKATRHSQILGAVFLLMLAAGLRMIRLDHGISGDELGLYGLARQPLSDIYRAVITQEVYSPLGAYLLHAWMTLGTSEVWARLYFVLFGLALCAVTYALVRELIGGAWGLMALGASAVSPLLIATSQYIRGYADGSFWSALGLVALLRLWRGQGGRGAWVLYATATLAAFYTFYFTLLVWVAANLWLGWRLWRDRRQWRPWVAAHAVIVAAMIPGLLLAFYQVSHNSLAIRFNWAGTGFQIGSVHVGILGRNLVASFGFDPAFGFPGISRLLPFWTLMLLLAAVLAGSAAVVRAGSRQLQAGPLAGGASFCLMLWLFPLAMAQVTGEVFGMFANAKYLLVPHVVFLVIIVAAVRALPQRRIVAASAILLVAYGSRLPAVYTPEYDTRGVERYIATIQAPGAIVLVFGPLPVAPSTPSWFDVHPLFAYDFATARYLVSQPRALDAVLAGVARVIYLRIHSNQELFGGNAVMLDYLALQGFVLKQTERFKGIDVMTFVKPEARR